MKNKAIFLDRDGILNYEIGDYVCRPSEFKIIPGREKIFKTWQDLGYLFIIITNQGGISRGYYSESTLNDFHQQIIDYYKKYDIVITDVFYCPHHPVIGNCFCRKPDSLMIEKAMALYNIDPTQSYMIGDRERDVEAAEKVGIKGILVNSNIDLSEDLLIL